MGRARLQVVLGRGPVERTRHNGAPNVQIESEDGTEQHCLTVGSEFARRGHDG